MENTTFTQNDGLKPDAPMGLATLILGIISLVTTALSCTLGGGIITGIIGLVLASKGNKDVELSPGKYSEKSIKNIKIGKTMSLIGLIISAVGFSAYMLFMLVMILAEGF